MKKVGRIWFNNPLMRSNILVSSSTNQHLYRIVYLGEKSLGLQAIGLSTSKVGKIDGFGAYGVLGPMDNIANNDPSSCSDDPLQFNRLCKVLIHQFMRNIALTLSISFPRYRPPASPNAGSSSPFRVCLKTLCQLGAYG